MSDNGDETHETGNTAMPPSSGPKSQKEKSPPALSIYLGPQEDSERRMKALDHLTERLGLRGRSTLIQWIADGRLWVVAPAVPYVEGELRTRRVVAAEMIEEELDGFVEKLQPRKAHLEVVTMLMDMLQSAPDSVRDQLMAGIRDRVEALKRMERAKSKLREIVEQVARRPSVKLPPEGRKYEGNKERLERSAAEIHEVMQGYIGPKVRLPEASISIEVDLVSMGSSKRPNIPGVSVQPYWRDLLSVTIPGDFTGFYAVELYGREIADKLGAALKEEEPKESDQGG